MGRTSKRSQTAGHEAIRTLAPNTAPEGPDPDPGGADQPTWKFPWEARPLSLKLVKAAKDFKQIFRDNQAEFHVLGGQFALVDSMGDALRGMIATVSDTPLRTALLALVGGDGWDALSEGLGSAGGIRNSKPYRDALPDGHPDKPKPYGVLRSASTVMAAAVYTTTTANARQLMNAADVSAADKALATAILTDHTANGDWAYGQVNQWLGQTKLGPAIFDKSSLPRYYALYLDSLIMCGSAAQFTAKQLFKTRAVSTQTLPSFPAVTLTGLSAKDSRSTANNLMLNYNATRLQNAMEKAATLLNAGGYLVAGCLSGMKYEADAHPFPEHYILLFAADDKTFLFWDPDVLSADIHEMKDQLGKAIGVLFYDDTDPTRPKFSTGIDFDDLSGIETDGDHKKFPERHRYQIVTLKKP